MQDNTSRARLRLGFIATLDPGAGNPPQVLEGQLIIFVGGSKEVYQQCRPVFSAVIRTSHQVTGLLPGAGPEMAVYAE